MLGKKSRRIRSVVRGKKGTLRTPTLMLVVLSLTTLLGGCATKTTSSAVDCPEPVKVPAHLVEERSANALDYSTRVQDFLQRAREFASKTRATSTQSEK